MHTTNIFCIIANAGSNQELYLSTILSDSSFTRNANLELLLYNTTKPKFSRKKNNLQEYNYMTEEEYNAIDSSEMIEFRSYYTIPFNTVFFFTVRSNIENKGNLICVASPYQYENYKKWAAIENMRHPGRYNVYAILVHCAARDRFQNKINTHDDSFSDDIELLEFCRRVLQDNAEFNDTKSRVPELNDPMNCDNVCYINDTIYEKERFNQNVKHIKTFILDKVNKD